jgi:hypothetical protein
MTLPRRPQETPWRSRSAFDLPRDVAVGVVGEERQLVGIVVGRAEAMAVVRLISRQGSPIWLRGRPRLIRESPADDTLQGPPRLQCTRRRPRGRQASLRLGLARASNLAMAPGGPRAGQRPGGACRAGVGCPRRAHLLRRR